MPLAISTIPSALADHAGFGDRGSGDGSVLAMVVSVAGGRRARMGERLVPADLQSARV